MLLGYAQQEWKMHQLANSEYDDINDLLEQWEQLKNTPIPVPISLNDALEFTKLKDTISNLSHQIRTSRLENSIKAEAYYISHFYVCYYCFTEQFVFRILKHG